MVGHIRIQKTLFLPFCYHSFLKSCSALGNLLLKQNTSTETNLQLSLLAVSPQMSTFPCPFLCPLSPTPHTPLPLPNLCLFILPSLQIQRRKAKKSVDVKGWTEGEASDLPGGEVGGGGSQRMSDTVPCSLHTLDKEY